jgi:uncharacterized protein (DUF1697 family)
MTGSVGKEALYIALLRGINVGGRNPIAMSDLRSLLTTLGFSSVRSLLQSGNLVFAGNRRPGANLEHLLEAETAKQLKMPADYIVRTANEWVQIVAGNPFPDVARNDPGHLIVMCLKRTPTTAEAAALQTVIKGPEVVHVEGRQAYIYYRAGVGRSKLTHAVIENTLGSRGTGRNWNTVLKLLALAQA